MKLCHNCNQLPTVTKNGWYVEITCLRCWDMDTQGYHVSGERLVEVERYWDELQDEYVVGTDELSK